MSKDTVLKAGRKIRGCGRGLGRKGSETGTSASTAGLSALGLGVEAPFPGLVLDDLVRDGARRMLQAALDTEVRCFVERHQGIQDEFGRRQIVRNGHNPERVILTGAGPLEVRQPRVRDKRTETEEKMAFTSEILPPYLRRSKTIDELIPWLYLKGISTGAMGEALQALAGPDAKGLSADVVVRLKEQWTGEFEAWNKRDLSGKEYVYVWADGVYFNIRLDGDDRQCILVLMGATKDGRKELLAVQDGYRESAQSWKEMLLDLKARGLTVAPRLAIADGALGFWAALREVYGDATREQRCWFHKTGNVLDKMPKSVQARAKAGLHDIWMAETRKEAEKAFDRFIAKYEAKYPKAVECLRKDRDVLLTFYDFPAEHWAHLRTTNPIESTFATVRLRHNKTKGNGTRAACLAMVFKLCLSAEGGWRRLNGYEHMLKLVEGVKYIDGIEVKAIGQENAAA